MKKLLTLMGALSLTVGGVSSSVFATPVQTGIKVQATEDQTTNIEWLTLNKVFATEFSDSTEYLPTIENYKPDAWWKVWDWGAVVSFPEGDVNAMRIVKIVMDAYNSFNFYPLEQLLTQVDAAFNYLVNIDSHNNNSVSTVVGLLNDSLTAMEQSGIAFAPELLDTIQELINIFEPVQTETVSTVKAQLQKAVEDYFGFSIEEVGKRYSLYLKVAANSLKVANLVFTLIQTTTVGPIANTLFGNLKQAANDIVSADTNKLGVKIKLQQYITPVGGWQAI